MFPSFRRGIDNILLHFRIYGVIFLFFLWAVAERIFFFSSQLWKVESLCSLPFDAALATFYVISDYTKQSSSSTC